MKEYKSTLYCPNTNCELKWWKNTPWNEPTVTNSVMENSAVLFRNDSSFTHFSIQNGRVTPLGSQSLARYLTAKYNKT